MSEPGFLISQNDFFNFFFTEKLRNEMLIFGDYEVKRSRDLNIVQKAMLSIYVFFVAIIQKRFAGPYHDHL